MKWERLILIPFLGNYLVNNIGAALAALAPAGSGASRFTSPQYIVFIIVALILVALFAWWYLKPMPKMEALKWGAIFGVAGFVISILTTFISGIAGVLAQTGSFAQVAAILPNFGPFLWNWSTLILFLFWIIPSIAIGWWMGRSMSASRPAMSMSSTPGGM
jgi:hypothetical protein